MIRRRTTRRVREKIFPSLAVVAVVTVVAVVAVARATSACAFSTVHPTPSTSSIPPSAHAPRTRPARSRSRARATGRSPFPRRTREDIFSIFPSPPPRDAWGARSREYASPRARDFRVRVVEIDFLESPLVVSPPGVSTPSPSDTVYPNVARRWFCVRIPFKRIRSIEKHHSRTR